MIRRLFVLTLFSTLAAGSGSRAIAAVDFQKEVLPILSQHCTLCHGIDAQQRQGGLRLDQRETALRGGESGTPAIVSGKPDESGLVRRITSADGDVVMPPPSHSKPLSAGQIETLRQWIAEGAAYQSHWAFVPPQKAPLPAGGPAHPVDAWVAARLRELKISPSPEASGATFCRRMVESGARFVPLFHEVWDQQGNLTNGVKQNALDTDRASAALMADLKERGLLNDTILIWGGEFGRTPMVPGGNDGRDHHNRCFRTWLAGGGRKAGYTHGQTDELGFNIAVDPVHVHDLNATLLHLLGLDHLKLTFRFQGRDYRLTDVHGRVVQEIIA